MTTGGCDRVRQVHRRRVVSGLGATAAGVLLTLPLGCATSPDTTASAAPEVVRADGRRLWSTKSLSAGGTEAPTLNVAATPEPTLPVMAIDPGASAREIITSALTSSSPELRAHAIQATEFAPGLVEDAVRQGLVDANRGVRFVAAMMVGRMQLHGVSHLAAPLLDDSSESVQAAAIYALRRCGEPADPSRLARMIRSEDPEVRGNAALVLGELGNPSAAPMLRSALGRGLVLAPPIRVRLVELQMAEAMVRLGQASEIESIRAALFAPSEEGEVAALACLIAGRLGDARAAPNLRRLAMAEGQAPPEIRLAAAMGLSELGQTDGLGTVALLFAEHPQFQVRAQAASTLGLIGSPAGIPTLQRLLRDENPLVQVSAAAAILRIESRGR